MVTPISKSQNLKIYNKDKWSELLKEVSVSRSDLNLLVMNYLITEGYQSSALKFSQEASMSVSLDLTAIGDRVSIRLLINSGRIQEAIEKINDTDPDLLDLNPKLHFALLRLQLIELIRDGYRAGDDYDILPALEFASKHLSGRASSDPIFLSDLEKTMALLCFPSDNLVPELKELMDLKLRKKIADQVNDTILRRQGMDERSKIENLVKLWKWGEHDLASKVGFPQLTGNDLF